MYAIRSYYARILPGHCGDELLQRGQHLLGALADQQAAVIGGPAIGGDHGSSRVRGGLDIGQLQDAWAEYGMTGGWQPADVFDEAGHVIDGVDPLLRVGGMGRNAEGLDHDLGTAALADLLV